MPPDDGLHAWYDRHARLYARLTPRIPVVNRLRHRAVAHLGLESGDTVADMGAGPGSNLQALSPAVDPDGTIICVELSSDMAAIGRRRAGSSAHIVRGDARHPPIRGPLDGVLATFVITLFEHPDRVIDRWWELLAPGGRLALLNLAPATGPFAKPMNRLLGLGLRITTPNTSEIDEDLVELLRRRIARAHEALASRAASVTYNAEWDDTIRLVVGEKGGTGE